jgi:hypothetical protein
MPFAVRDIDLPNYPQDHWREVYAGLLRPAIEAAGMRCHRDDDDLSSRPISLHIWKKIEEADIVLCDISSSNPNVFLELGWAIRAEKPYVIAMDEITRAPFDIGDFNRFQYDHALRPLTLQGQIPKLGRMLSETLLDPKAGWSILSNLGIASPALVKRARPRCTVDIYYFESQFTRSDANRIAAGLQLQGIPFRLMEHSDPAGPDAAFVGSMVEASDARLVLSLVPYDLKYLFRPDYPEADGGDSSGYKIGIGYSSRYNDGRRAPRAEPVRISAAQWEDLLSPDHSNTSFHQRLWDLTLRASEAAGT